MSIWAVNWALHTDVPNATHKLVLIALANFCDDQDEAWPHVDTLASLASTSRRTIFRALDHLETEGLLVRYSGKSVGAQGGLRQVNTLYRLMVPSTVSRRVDRHSPRPPLVQESGSQVRGDMAVTPGAARRETPSEVRGDMAVTPDSQGVTGGTGGVTPVSSPYKEEPSGVTTNPTPLPPAEVQGVGSVGSSSTIKGACDAWELVRDCLPREMQALDGATAKRVAALLEERLAAGWSAAQIHSTLAGNALPSDLRSLGGLVLHRIGQIAVADAPQRRGRPAQARPADGPKPYPLWMEARVRAQLLDAPEAARSRAEWVQAVDGSSKYLNNVDLVAAVRRELGMKPLVSDHQQG